MRFWALENTIGIRENMINFLQKSIFELKNALWFTNKLIHKITAIW